MWRCMLERRPTRHSASSNTVRTGEPAFEVAFGESFFSYLRSHPEAGASFDGMMSQLSRRVVAARERYLEEYQELLGSCGFTVHEVIALPSGFSLLDCRPRVA